MMDRKSQRVMHLWIRNQDQDYVVWTVVENLTRTRMYWSSAAFSIRRIIRSQSLPVSIDGEPDLRFFENPFCSTE